MRHDFRTLPPTIEELRAQCLRFHHRAPMAVCRDDVDDYSFDHCIICRSADTIAALHTEIEGLRNDLSDALDVKVGHGPTVLTYLPTEIAALRGKLVEMLRFLVERHKCSLDPLCGVCKWLAANREDKL